MVITGTSVFFSAWPKWIGAVGQAARARELDVVGAQHLEHLGAHQPHDQRHLEQRQRDRRQDQVLPARRASAGRSSTSRAPRSRRARTRAASRAARRTPGSAGCRSGTSAATRPTSETASSTCDSHAVASQRRVDAHRDADDEREQPRPRATAPASPASAPRCSVETLRALAQRQAELALHRVTDELRRTGRRTAGPVRARARSSRALFGRRVLAEHEGTGSPTYWNSENAMKATASMTTDGLQQAADDEREHGAENAARTWPVVSNIAGLPRYGNIPVGARLRGVWHPPTPGSSPAHHASARIRRVVRPTEV